jgi:hypothetical protein
MIVVLLSQKWLLFSSLRHDCCSPLSDMIVVLLSPTWLLFSSLLHDEKRPCVCYPATNEIHALEIK